MIFEYDPHKSGANLEKHGIDFEEAQVLWDDENMLEAPLAFPNEPRFICVGRIGEKLWAAIVTYREGKTRIISARRARKEEAKRYENR